MSRRAQKKVSTFTSGSWSLTSSTTYLYDGWNLVKEQSTTNNQPSTSLYVWGLDLSGSLQGAGGIGGLRARVKDGSVQQYTYDGNGNVSELVDGTGNIVAHYEYDPYGNLIVGSGDNPFRFSTKYLDAETGLYYYGYRYYSPTLGRWLNRDPLGDWGHLKTMAKEIINSYSNYEDHLLYLFVKNSPISSFDVLGLREYLPENYSYVCSDDTIKKFFDKLNDFADLDQLSSQLHIDDKKIILALVAWESTWGTSRAYNECRNPFGFGRAATKAERLAGKNRVFYCQGKDWPATDRLTSAADKWSSMYGEAVKGAKTIDDLVTKLQNLPNGKKYNDEDPRWEPGVPTRYRQIKTFLECCNNGKFKCR